MLSRCHRSPIMSAAAAASASRRCHRLRPARKGYAIATSTAAALARPMRDFDLAFRGQLDGAGLGSSRPAPSCGKTIGRFQEHAERIGDLGISRCLCDDGAMPRRIISTARRYRIVPDRGRTLSLSAGVIETVAQQPQCDFVQERCLGSCGHAVFFVRVDATTKIKRPQLLGLPFSMIFLRDVLDVAFAHFRRGPFRCSRRLPALADLADCGGSRRRANSCLSAVARLGLAPWRDKLAARRAVEV